MEILPGPNACWKWTGCINDWGYGRIKVNGKIKPAHWFFWEEFIEPVPPGFELHHVCGNRNCVRPSHLRLHRHGEHLAIHAQERRNKFSPEERDEQQKKRQREANRRQRDKMKANEMVRRKRKMPDGTYLNLWVPKYAGYDAVTELFDMRHARGQLSVAASMIEEAIKWEKAE